MLGNSDLVAFLATTDLDRARAFFEATLGLTLLSEDPFACTFDAHGAWTAPGGTCVTWFKDPDGNTLSLSQPA